MANLERIRNVIERIELNTNPNLHFDMSNWNEQSDCGTSMCFAGWAAFIEGKEISREAGSPFRVDGLDIEKWAKDYFGFTEDQARYIFYHMVDDDLGALKDHINLVLGTVDVFA